MPKSATKRSKAQTSGSSNDPVEEGAQNKSDSGQTMATVTSKGKKASNLPASSKNKSKRLATLTHHETDLFDRFGAD